MKYFSLLFVSLVLTLRATDLYVAVDGNDRNPGTLAQPFRSLEAARNTVRTRFKNGDAAAREAVTVWIRAGTYQLARTFELTNEDSGVAGARTTYAAYAGEAVKLSGGVALAPQVFVPVRDTDALRRLPAGSREHVLQANLKALGISDFGRHRQFGHGLPVVPAPLELFWNDAVLPLARYPNTGAIPLGAIIDPGSMPRNGDYSNRGGRFHYSDAHHDRWVVVPDVWLQGYFNNGYADDKIRIAAIDPKSKEVTLASPHMYSLATGNNFNQYVALNLLEELDQPGEWYLDRTSGMLYVWPLGDVLRARISVSVLDQPLVVLDHASYCTLRGLTIEDGRGIGVYLEGGQGNEIADCVVRNVGTVGIMLGQGARQTAQITVDGHANVPASREVGSFQSLLYQNTIWDRDAGKDHVISK